MTWFAGLPEFLLPGKVFLIRPVCPNIMRNFPLEFVAIFLIAVLSAAGFCQETYPSAAQGMKLAMAAFESGRYGEAFRHFDRLAELFPIDEHQSVFQYMAAKSLYYDGRYEAADERARRIIRDLPRSSLIPAGNLIIAASQYAMGNLLESAAKYLEIIDSPGSIEVQEIARKNLLSMMQTELKATELLQLASANEHSRMAEEIYYYACARLIQIKDYEKAIANIRAYMDKFPDGRFRESAAAMLETARKETENRIKIGLLAPLSGAYSEYGRNLVDGAGLAFEDFSMGGKKIELIIKDTEGSPVRAVQMTRELVNEKPMAIIGPLRSETAVGAATAASFSGVPMILPTSSERDLALLGDNVFQLSPPAEEMAKAVAEYAVAKLGLKEFGIISPSDIASRQVTAAFADKVYELGGQVVAITFYEIGQTDFAQQIKPLRDALLIKTEELLAVGQADSNLYYDTLNQKWLDQKNWRVYLDGLFLPGYAEELVMLVPQIRYNVITTRYFGLYGWDSQTLIDRIGDYIDGAVFAADFHLDENEQTWRKFSRRFESEFKRKPDRIAGLAYDAASIIKEAIEHGKEDPQGILDYINTIGNHDGVVGRIDFEGGSRINTAVEIYRISHGIVEKAR